MRTQMSEQRGDHVTIGIDEKLARLTPSHSEHCIFRVHDMMRQENANAYEPIAIAIGPYHCGKNNLQAMEVHKLRYLKQFLDRSNETSVHRFVMVLRDLEERARKCYAESINLSKDQFVEMMLLDGCFIAHLLRKIVLEDNEKWDPNDPILKNAQTTSNVVHDLMLLENQLPFFVLVQLIDMTKSTHPLDKIEDLARYSLGRLLQPLTNVPQPSAQVSTNNVDHILGFIYGIWCSSFAEVVSEREMENREVELELIKCTTELRKAGVEFKKSSNEAISLLDIKFENGVIEIPPLTIWDSSEGMFRNLIAYEQHFSYGLPRYVSDYMKFMDCLIDSAEDVKKLCHKGIIVNWMSDSEVVSTMFNKLCNQVVHSDTYSYSKIFNIVNKHCGKRRNIWLANLRGNYFNNPWSSISFGAATLLLLFTLLQTIYSVLSYYK